MRVPALLPTLISAAALNAGTVAAADDELLYCEVTHENHAWGYQHSGVFIDPTGRIGQFDYSQQEVQWTPNRTDQVTEQELRSKYQPGRQLVGNVCPQRLQWLRKQIDQVRYSPASKPAGTGMADFGVNSTVCYAYRPDQLRGQTIVLRVTGDYEQHNEATDAAAVANWLEAVADYAKANSYVPMKMKGCIDSPPSLQPPEGPPLVQNEMMRQRVQATLAAAWGFRHSGRMVGGGNAYPVRPRVTPQGITIEQHPSQWTDTQGVLNIIAYEMGGAPRYPAVRTTLMASGVGAITTQHMGWCTAIPKP